MCIWPKIKCEYLQHQLTLEVFGVLLASTIISAYVDVSLRFQLIAHKIGQGIKVFKAWSNHCSIHFDLYILWMLSWIVCKPLEPRVCLLLVTSCQTTPTVWRQLEVESSLHMAACPRRASLKRNVQGGRVGVSLWL